MRFADIQAFDDGGDVGDNPPMRFNDIQPEEAPDEGPTQFADISSVGQSQPAQSAPPTASEQPGPIGAAIAGAAPAAAPITAAIAAGARTMAAIPNPWIGIPAGIAAGLVASGVVGKIQDWLRDQYGPSTGPLSKPYEAAAAEQQPLAYNVGRAAPIAAGMTTGNVTPLVRAASAGLLGSVDVLQQGIEKGFGNINPTEALVQAGAGALLPQAREWAGGARPYTATAAPQVGEEGVTPSGTTAAPVPKTSAQSSETPVGKPATPDALAEQQAQGQKTAPFNTSNAVGTSSTQPPPVNSRLDRVTENTILPGGTLDVVQSNRQGLKPGVGSGQPGQGIEGAPSTVVDTAPIPEDVAAALPQAQTQGQPAAPEPPTGAPTPGPAAAPAAPAPAPAGRPPVQAPVQTSAPPEATPPEGPTPTGLEGQVPNLGQVIHDAIAASADRPIVRAPMPSIGNSANDIKGPIVIDPHKTFDNPAYQRLIAAHETIEDTLEKLGMSPTGAGHDFATIGEKTLAEQLGIDWNKYSKDVADAAPEIEGQPVTPEMRAQWQQQVQDGTLHVDPMTDIGHHTTKDIQGDLQHDLNSPNLSPAEAGNVPDYNEIPDFLQRQPPAAQEAIAKSTGQPTPAMQAMNRINMPPRLQQATDALLNKWNEMMGSTAAGGGGGAKVPPPDFINPDPRDGRSPNAFTSAADYTKSLYDRFNLMLQRGKNSIQQMRNMYMKAPNGSNEDWETVGKAYTQHLEDQLPDNLKPLYDWYTKVAVPAQEKAYKDAYDLNKRWKLFDLDKPHDGILTRFMPRQDLSEDVIQRGEDVISGKGIAGFDPALQPRSFKTAVEVDENGKPVPGSKPILIKDQGLSTEGDGTGKVTRWINGQPKTVDYNVDESNTRGLRDVGTKFQIGGEEGVSQPRRYVVDHADAHHIEEQGIKNLTGAPMQFNKNPVTATMTSTEGMMRARDTMRLLNDIKEDPKYNDNFIKTSADNADKLANEKWGGLYKTNLPQFKGLYMSQGTAQALNDFNGSKIWTPNGLEQAAQSLIKSMYVVGFPIHGLNVAAQWFIGKPWSNTQAWRGLLEDFPRAYKDVMTQGDIQKEIRDAGGNTQLFSVLDDKLREQIFRNAGQEMVKNGELWQRFADKTGQNVPQMAQNTYDWSRTHLWQMNDVLYTQQYMTYRRMGLQPADAVKQTERFINNYRLYNTVLGSRTLAQLYNTPALSLFGRYHAGLWNSWQDVITGLTHKIDPESGFFDQQRKEAISASVAMGVLGMFVFPYILNPIAQAATGNKDASFAPRGMLTIPAQLGKIAAGQASYESAIPNVFTPSLPISAGMEALRNQDWTGQPLIPRNDLRKPGNVVRAALQGVDAAGRALIPPYSSLASNLAEKGTNPGRVAGKFILGNLGIRNPSPGSVNYMDNIQKNNARLQKEHRAGPLERVYNKLTGQ